MGPSPDNLEDMLRDLLRENERLKHEILGSKKIPTNKIGIALIIIGALPLSTSIIAPLTTLFPASIIASSTTLAFIGLALTFWGILFLFARPTKFVKSALLDSTAISSYTTIDRIIKDLGYKGRSYYIPPYPKEVYLPEYLKGLKNMIVFVSADTDPSMPSIEDMAKGRFLLEKPKGISVTPPGMGLVNQLENEMKTDLTNLSYIELLNELPRVLLENLRLAEEIRLEPEDSIVHIKIVGSKYQDLYESEENLKCIHSLGCPIVSAATVRACTSIRMWCMRSWWIRLAGNGFPMVRKGSPSIPIWSGHHNP